mmetsp:Transcript_33278/g.70765  ORF Transcript_33278/g.70765 Transcript_33278/m.70765 type:complete len:168 (+) Transcript_33278:69-572(+)
MGQACDADAVISHPLPCSGCGAGDDALVRALLKQLTPLDIDIDAGTKLRLNHADFADNDDNVIITSLREFEIRDVRLHGTVGYQVTGVGCQQLTALAILDIVKRKFEHVDVNVKDFRLDEDAQIRNSGINNELVKQQVHKDLQNKLDGWLRDREEDDDNESGSEEHP